MLQKCPCRWRKVMYDYNEGFLPDDFFIFINELFPVDVGVNYTATMILNI